MQPVSFIKMYIPTNFLEKNWFSYKLKIPGIYYSLWNIIQSRRILLAAIYNQIS